MEENIEKLGQKIKEKINSIKSMADAESVRVEALGKKGEVIEILKNLKNVEESKRKEVGDKANKLRVEIEELIEKKKEELKELEDMRNETPVIASIYGDSEEVFCEVAERTKDLVDAFELNVSCPHAKCGFGSNIGEDPEMTYNIVSSVKDSIKGVPIIVKLTPNVTDITTIATASEEAGADALTLINSVGPGLSIDYQTAKPILNNVLGGIAGPMIKPIALKCVYNTYKTVDIPIFGVGGIMNYKDVLEFMYAGASLLQIGTSIMYSGPEIFGEISEDLSNFLEENGYKNVTEIIGLSHEL